MLGRQCDMFEIHPRGRRADVGVSVRAVDPFDLLRSLNEAFGTDVSDCGLRAAAGDKQCQHTEYACVFHGARCS